MNTELSKKPTGTKFSTDQGLNITHKIHLSSMYINFRGKTYALLNATKNKSFLPSQNLCFAHFSSLCSISHGEQAKENAHQALVFGLLRKWFKYTEKGWVKADCITQKKRKKNGKKAITNNPTISTTITNNPTINRMKLSTTDFCHIPKIFKN